MHTLPCPFTSNRHNIKAKDFPLFSSESNITDDTIMTLAVAKAFMDADPESDDVTLLMHLNKEMRHFGRAYPDAGYGGRFGMWLFFS